MPTNNPIDTEWKKYTKLAKKNGQALLDFPDWYKKHYNAEPPTFLSEQYNKTKVEESTIHEFILSKIGMEPNASGSKRRWHFLRIMSKHIYEQKSISLNDFFKWTTANCQCMKMRTLRDDYLGTLEDIGLISFDLRTGKIQWCVENIG